MGANSPPDGQQLTGGRSDAGRTEARPPRWPRLRKRVDDLTHVTVGAAADIEYGWPLLLAWAAGGGLVVVAACRVVLTFTVNARTVIAVTGVAVVVAAAFACLIGLAWASWRIRLDATAAVPFGVALGISLLAIGICTEAFAALSALLWRHGLIIASPAVKPGLWPTERYYLWHLVDSVPLLKIPDGVQWREPVLFPGLAGGGLLLAYKVLLIAPLLRIAVAVYQKLASYALETQAREDDLIRRKVVTLSSYDETGDASTPLRLVALRWLLLTVPLVVLVLIVFLMPLVFEPGVWLDGWVARQLDGSRFTFLRTAPQWLAAWLLVWLAWAMADDLGFGDQVRRGRDLAMTVVWFLATVGLIVVAATAVNLALLHVGLASASPTIAPGEQVSATVTGYAWHIAEALPGPNIPGTLHWTLHHRFTDRWSTILILLTKLAVVSLIVVPVAQAIRGFARYASPHPATPGALRGAANFVEQFIAARAAADRATHKHGLTDSDPTVPIPILSASDANHAQPEPSAREATELVVMSLDSVAALFGPGEVTQHADAAVGALRLRANDVFGRELPQLREEERQSFAAYCETASQALEAACDRLGSARQDTD